MSAIAGIYYLDNRLVDLTDLARMSDTLAHRGTDGANTWSEASVGLVHRMLWTTPESLLERLPYHETISHLAITADARIDNREELISKLELSGIPFEKITDSQIVLAAYKKWGENCPQELIGDFAFVIWDGQKQQLFCARDHFGVKPFYYYHSDNLFAFGTEIKAIVSLAEIPRKLNEERVADYLTARFEDFSTTLYQQILRLPPASTLIVSPGKFEIKNYWELDPTKELKFATDAEYVAAFKEVFTEAIRCRLRSAFPIGSMLSGGLDSSSITCVARELLGEDSSRELHSFSVVFDQIRESDEREFQDAVIEQGNIQAHKLPADSFSPLTDEPEKIAWHQDEAWYFGNMYVNWIMQDCAQENGVRVLLDGFDGDTTLSHGYGYTYELAYSGRWLTLISEVKAYRTRRDEPWLSQAWWWLWNFGINPKLSRSGVGRKASSLALKAVRKLRGEVASKTPSFGSSELLNPEFRHRFSPREPSKYAERPTKTEREFHYRLLIRPLMTNVVEALDRVAGAHSLELRLPFFDKRLVEFCLALPPEQKLKQGWTRMILRRAMAGTLPEKVQWRVGKGNLQPSFDKGVLAYEQKRLEELILEKSHLLEPYLDMNLVRDIHSRYVAGSARKGDSNLIWKILTLGFWLEFTGIKP